MLVQPRDGVEPLITAINAAKKSIDILIFRWDRKDLETALKAASGRGVKIRALIAHTNRGGEPKLRNLETRFLAAGITVGRTADDLIRYHGKMMIVDGQTLYVLAFNFVQIDIDHSRGFGVAIRNKNLVREATRLFEADLHRQSFTSALNTFVVSPVNSRIALAAYIEKARKQLWIYDPKIADKEMLDLLIARQKAGVDIRVIGTISGRKTKLPASKLAQMRLHTRTMIRDGRDAFIGSQSLRTPELDSRREVGIIIRDSAMLKDLLSTFEEDWKATGFDEDQPADVLPEPTPVEAKASEALAKELPPLRTTLKKMIKQAVTRAGKEALAHPDLKATVKEVVKRAVKEAVNEMVKEE